jgi:hypothetical protein
MLIEGICVLPLVDVLLCKIGWVQIEECMRLVEAGYDLLPRLILDDRRSEADFTFSSFLRGIYF